MKNKILSETMKFYKKNLEVKVLYLLINQKFKIIKTVFMSGQKKEKKFMMTKKENGEKEKI